MFFFFLFSFCFSYVLNIDGVIFDEQDFYSKYTYGEWSQSSDSQKKRILEDYIKRSSCVLDAKNRGFHLDPVVLQKFKNRRKQLMVNFAYDYLVAKPVVDSLSYELAKKHIKKEVNLRHLLISHSNSALASPNQRSRDDALFLTTDILNKIKSNGDGFDSLVVLFSEDPGVVRNKGSLGWLQWGRTPMSFQSVVWELPFGEISSPIETPYGFHLVSVDSVRSSEYVFFDESSYNYAAFKSCLPIIRDQLAEASIAYEQTLFENNGRVKLIDSSITQLYSLLLERKSSLQEGEHFVLLDFLNNLEKRFVVCSFDGQEFGIKWLIPTLSNLPPARIPKILNKEDLVRLVRLLALQNIAVYDADNLKIDEELFFLKTFNDAKNNILYDFFVRDLVNSVGSPDSSKVKRYYLEKREDKYYEPEKVTIRQIKVSSKSLADSLLVELRINPSLFESFASNFSENRASVGGLMEPFERGKYNFVGTKAFELSVGSLSGVIENLDKTFSIIRLENKTKKSFIPLKRVYNRIEALLIKEYQEEIKTSTFDGYINNRRLTVGEEYKKFLN